MKDFTGCFLSGTHCVIYCVNFRLPWWIFFFSEGNSLFPVSVKGQSLNFQPRADFHFFYRRGRNVSWGGGGGCKQPRSQGFSVRTRRAPPHTEALGTRLGCKQGTTMVAYRCHKKIHKNFIYLFF